MTQIRKILLKPAVYAVLLVGGLLISGCGHGGPEVVPVGGQITLGGGPWPTAGVLYFTPVKSDISQRPGLAHFDIEGNFKVGSFSDADGLIPGRYKIAVECWRVAPTMGGAPAVSNVSAKYQNASTSDLEVTVVSSTPQTNLQLDVPKS